MAFADDLAALAVGEWLVAPSTGNYRLSDVYASPSPTGSQGAIIGSWNGAFYDSYRKDLVLLACGGHNDYYGNEVYAFNCDPLSGNYLTWRRKAFYSTESSGSVVENFSDDTPSSAHTYNNTMYDDGNDQALRLPGVFVNGSTGAFTERTYSFDMATESPSAAAPSAWSRLDDITLPAPGGGPYPIAIWDPVNQLAWIECDDGLVVFDPNETATNQYTALTSFESGTSNSGRYTSIYIPDATTPLLFRVGNSYTQTRDLTTPYAKHLLGQSGDNAISGDNGPGLLWDPINERVVAWGGTLSGGTDNRDLYFYDLDTETWTRSAGSGDIPDNPEANGTFGRFQYIGDGLAVLVNSTTSNVYFVRISGGGASGGDSMAWHKHKKYQHILVR